MAGKTGKTVSLEAIEEHLKRQDKEIKKSTARTLQAFGVTVFLAGLSFSVIPKILWYGLFLMVLGALFVIVILVESSWTKRIAKK